MKGMLQIIHADGRFSEVPHENEVTLDMMQAAVGGYIERVPKFNRIPTEEGIQRCVAFCNEDGKGNGLPVNENATMFWQLAFPGHWDHLVGDVLVVTGDDEFLEAL